MNIYYIIRQDRIGYDETISFVIIANFKDEVLKLAKDNCGDEGQDVWKIENIEELGMWVGLKTDPFILVNDFNAG